MVILPSFLFHIKLSGNRCFLKLCVFLSVDNNFGTETRDSTHKEGSLELYKLERHKQSKVCDRFKIGEGI